MRQSAKVLGVALVAALVACALVWYAALREDRRGNLVVAFLPSGAVFFETPSGRSVLVNGGPDDSILRELGDVMPFYDHSIDVVIAAVQTPANVGGLASVIPRYRVSLIARSAAHSSAPEVAAVIGAVSEAQQQGSRLLVLARGQTFDLGNNTYLEVFFPDRDASQVDAANGCLMFRLVFGNTSFFFACGTSSLEEYVAALDGSKLRSDVLAATGNEQKLFLGFVAPQFAVLPCGTNATSSFEVLEIQTLSACNMPVIFESDGQTVTRE